MTPRFNEGKTAEGEKWGKGWRKGEGRDGTGSQQQWGRIEELEAGWMDGGKTEVFCSTHMIRRSVTLPAAEAFRALKLCVSVSAQVSFRAEKLLLLMDASSVHYFDTLGCFCVPVRTLAFCILAV